MITPQTKVIVHSDVITTPLPNQEMVLLHLQTQQYYTLNETGMQIWKGLAQSQSLGEISQLLEMYYVLTLQEAEQQVIALVTELAAEGLIRVVETT
ncbi:MAG: PqqD family protein [Caldilineaceae bacterium]|nr:PqqD family protein [Caldilineaceae bacterium]